MTGYLVSASRTIPAEVERAFDVVMPEPLPHIFSRRYGPIGGVREVRDQPPSWSEPGQSRTIVLTDGATMTETLVAVDRPTAFGYRITDLTGPFKLIVAGVDGEWRFEPAGTGVRITWSWLLDPASSPARYALPAFARLWRGYARQALEEIEKILV